MKTLHVLQFFTFSICINLFTLFAYLVYQSDIILSNFRSKLQNEYDFIIVGSGTAGSLIAHRLATETNFTFIVLEAGSRSHPLLEIPVLGPLLHGSVFDWQFETVPQKDACLAMTYNKCKLTQGKILGGSAKFNNMIHIRGNLSHYVDWFHGMFTEDYIRNQFELLENGIFHINDLLYESEMSDAMLNAAIELGYNIINKDFKEGFMKSKLTIKNGKRWTTSDNLDIFKHVATNTLVEKLLIVHKKCVGVKLHNFPNVFARKAVILSAGAINSPKILQLSGVGPSKLLKSLGIPVIKDLPVGKNLQDHVGSGLDLVLFNRSLSVNPFNIMNPFNVLQYFINGNGSLTPAGCEIVGFLSTKNNTVPDLQFMVLPVGISTDKGSKLRKSLSLNNFVWDNYFAKLFDKHAATIFALILHPKSKGEVYITSRDPLEKPAVDPKYLTNKDDVKILVDGLKIVKKFIDTEAIKGLGGHINSLPFPGCEKYPIFSNSYWECYIKHLTLTSYHPIGTCSMGLPHEKTSVVDTSFKVISIEGLYVADSSVLPTLPSGNINAAIAMMASIFFESIKKSTFRKYENVGKGFSYKENLFLKTCVT